MVHHPAVNVLFTSAGRRIELLRAFRQAYKTLALPGNLVVADIDLLAPAIQVADRSYLVPRFTDKGYIPALCEICRQENIDLIFPLIDPDINILAQNRALLESTGARGVAVSEEAGALCSDKWLTTEFFRSLGLVTPKSWLPEHLSSASIEFPVFIKPRNGSGAKSTFKVENAQQLAFFLDYVPFPIVQEFIAGPEITNDVTCDLNGEVLAVVSRQRIEVRWGEVAKGVTVYDAAITDACVRIAKALPAIGPITVQCIVKDGIPYFTEINARFGGGLPLGIAAGVDSPLWFLAKAAGIDHAIPPLGVYKTGLYITRFDDAFYLNSESVASSCVNTEKV